MYILMNFFLFSLTESYIWANVQEIGEPFRTHFDLSRAAHWTPFFTNRFPIPPLPSVQVIFFSFFKIVYL
jgi:hypothetical protein